MPRLVDPAVRPGSLARLSQPVVDLGDLLLRPWQASDAPAVAAAYSDPGIQRCHARSMTEAEALAWIGSWAAGYRLEGIRRGEALHADGWHDMHVHARLAEDRADA